MAAMQNLTNAADPSSDPEDLATPAGRLRWARKRAGYRSATEAARARGWPASTYLGHENGYRLPNREYLKRYARAFRVRTDWILEGEGTPSAVEGADIPIVGTIQSTGTVEFLGTDERPQEGAAKPPALSGTSESYVALVAKGTVMPGLIEDGTVVYYEDIRRPVADDLIGSLCVAALVDGSVRIGRIFRGRYTGTYDVVTAGLTPAARDQEIEWAAKVEWIRPQ